MTEALALIMLAILVGKSVTFIAGRASARRSVRLAESEAVELPCRVRWENRGTRRSFSYAKVRIEKDRLMIVAPGKKDVAMTLEGAPVQTGPSWRPGLAEVRRSMPSGEAVTFLTSKSDAKILEQALSQSPEQ
ncbi:hypothetical protein [Streptomyces sp. NPDC001758]